MKYRVKQIDSTYYPQYRNFFGFWCYYTYVDQYDLIEEEQYYFLQDAEDYIRSRIKYKHKPTTQQVIIHEFKE